MSLSRYDPIKNCFVLKDLMPPEIINAFHPDYVKTYMPEFLSDLRTESSQYLNGVTNGGKSKASREAKGEIGINSIHRFPDTKPREFHMYSKAGTANVTPKGKKK